MDMTENYNYERIAKAIQYIQTNFKSQPSLEEIAAYVNISPFHFQRLFQQWAGTTPKKFLQYISLSHAKSILNSSNSITQATYESGLSSTSRLHDLFVKIEGMTPFEYKNKGANLIIYYSFHPSKFGNILVASTHKGICHIAFAESLQFGLGNLRKSFAHAELIPKSTDYHKSIEEFFNSYPTSSPKQFTLHLKGTAFQLKVWEALLKIPMGDLRTYAQIGHAIGNPKSSRAVGTAIGSNPIAYLIPCHRVIQTSGLFGGYMWGPIRKAAIIGWENAQLNIKDDETI